MTWALVEREVTPTPTPRPGKPLAEHRDPGLTVLCPEKVAIAAAPTP